MTARRSLVAMWRDAIRDSDLDRTAVLVAHTLSTYMNREGRAFPSKATLAAGAKLGAGKRSVDSAVDRIEAAGFLRIERSKGRRSFRYFATLPTSHVDASLFAANVARGDAQRRTIRRPTSHEGATESAESAESLRRAHTDVRAASLIVEVCPGCDESFETADADAVFCPRCSEAV